MKEEELYELPEEEKPPPKGRKQVAETSAPKAVANGKAAVAFEAKPRVLFVSKSNIDASIVAEAVGRHHRLDLEVGSCGTEPAGKMSPTILASLFERRIPVDSLRIQSVSEVGGFEAWDLIVITDPSVGRPE